MAPEKVVAVAVVLACSAIVAVGQSCPWGAYEYAPEGCWPGAGPRVIPGTPGQHVVVFDTASAATSGYVCREPADHLVWCEFTPTVTGPVTISTCDPATGYDTAIAVYAGGDDYCQGISYITCNDDVHSGDCVFGPRPSGCYYGSIVAFEATANQLYRFVVGADPDFSGEPCTRCLGVIVTIGEPCGLAPTNYVCEYAMELPGTPGTHELEVDAEDVVTPNEDWLYCSLGVGHIIWFKVTPTVSGPLTLTTCHPNTMYDTVVRALEGVDGCWELEELDCNDDTPVPECDNFCGFHRGSVVTLNGLAGHTYFFEVGSYNNNSVGCPMCLGVSLTIEDACANETTPPVALITSPAGGCVCDTVTITGSAYDPDGTFRDYALEYQVVGDPNSPNWNWVGGGTSPMYGAELGTWSASSLDQGYYLLRLTVNNTCGMSTSDVRLVWHDNQFDQFVVDYPPNLAVVSGRVCVAGTMWDSCFLQYTVEYRAMGGGEFQPVDPNQPVYTTRLINAALASWDTTTISNGDYLLMITAQNTCGAEFGQQLQVVVDNQPPDAYISSPAGCVRVGDLLYITGTANDANLASWSLSYTGGMESWWVPIAGGTEPVIDGLLGVLNTAGVEPCACTLRLLVSDAAIPGCNSEIRATTEYLVTVHAGLVQPGDINCDGLVNFGDINPFVTCLTTGTCQCP